MGCREPASELAAPSRSPRLPAGVVFDCDGTLADTETLSDRAWEATLARYGYQPSPEDFEALLGRTFEQNWAYFTRRAQLGERTVFLDRLRRSFRALFDAELELYPDAIDTLRACVAAGIPVAVASSSRRAHVRRVLERGDLTAAVTAVIAADDVDRHKPDPEPYLAAAAALRVDAPDCSAVEDTPIGVASALAAGMFTVAVRRPHGATLDLDAADRVVGALTFETLHPPDGGGVS